MRPDLYPANWPMLAQAGQTGSTGSPGTAATIALGSVTTLAAGQPASVTNVGTSTAAVLNFALPAGAPGAAAGNVNQAAATLAGPLLRSLGTANLFDASRVTFNTLVWTDGSVVPWNPNANLYTSDFTLCAGLSTLSFNNNVGNGLVFYDANKSFLSYLPGGLTTVAVPANAAYFRFTSSGSPATMVAIAGPPASVPSAYVPYGVTNAAVAQALAQVPLTLGPLAGKNLGIFGDSITAAFGYTWMPTVATRTNATFGFNDSLSGRETRFVFSNYNNGALKPNDGSGTSPAGHTLAQDLANVDLLLLELGTNDGGQFTGNNLGSPTDAPNMNFDATFSASIAGVITTLLAAKPTLRIVWMTPWQDNPTNGHAGCNSLACSQAINQTIVNVCSVYSVPVVNMLTESGINASTWSTYLLDGVHPSSIGGAKVIGPLVGQKLNLYY
jgi:lysophospholipase L1-like esterase